MEKIGSSSSQVQEPVNSEQAEFPNESTVTAVTVPPIFATKDHLIANWFSWKNEFLAYLRRIDKAGDNRHLWGIMLLNRMGPVGQKIHRTFIFYDKNEQEDITALIKRFDIYCMYGDAKRGGEDIDRYINDLIFIAVTWNHDDPAAIVKEKIIQDISAQRFTGKAALLIESKGENFIPYLQSLGLNEIILFWKQCDDLMAQKIEETPKRDSPYAEPIGIEYTRSSMEHKRNRCPAWRNCLHLLFCAQCNKCKQLNYFTDRHKAKYIYSCAKCGMNHLDLHCPAYGELCTKCGERNHFSLKCPSTTSCSKCGTNHAASTCPAQGQIHRHYKKPNHLEEQCASKLNDGQHKHIPMVHESFI